MKKTALITHLTLGLLLAAGLGAQRAGATPITGSISFDGSATTNTGSLATATSITGIADVEVTASSQSGSYATVPNLYMPVTFSVLNSFSNNALNPQPLWTFTYNGATYSFTATSIAVDLQNSNFLDLSGTGMADISGSTATAADWTIDLTTAANGGISVAFGSSAFVPVSSPVPDAGATAALIGLGLAAIGLGALARRRPAAAG